MALFLVAHPKLLLAQPAPSGGGSPPRVVLFAKEPPDPLLRRVTAELHSLGFFVVTVPDDETPKSAAQMETIAQSSDAVAAVRVAVGETSIDLWIVNLRTHEMVLRRVVSGKDPTVAALRSVEALRVSLVDLQALLPPPPEPEPEPPRPREARETLVVPPPPARRPALGFELGLGVASGSGGFSGSLHAVGQVEWMAGTHWAIHVLGVAPLMSSRVTANEGSAEVTFGLLGTGVTWQLLAPGPFTPYLGAGVAGVLLYTRGVPSAGFVGYSQVNLMAAPYLRAGSSFSLASGWRLSADLLAAASTPEPVVFFGDRRASAWGRPLLLGDLGIEITVP
jgi:hypothetical protein